MCDSNSGDHDGESGSSALTRGPCWACSAITGDYRRFSRPGPDRAIPGPSGIASTAPESPKSSSHRALRAMARPGLEPGTPRFSVLRPNLSNRAKSPAIKRLLVGSPREAGVSYLRTFALQLGTQISFGTQSTPMAATSPVNARPRVRLDGGVPAASCSAPVNHDVGGLSERRARRTCARVAIASGVREEQAPSDTRSRRPSNSKARLRTAVALALPATRERCGRPSSWTCSRCRRKTTRGRPVPRWAIAERV